MWKRRFELVIIALGAGVMIPAGAQEEQVRSVQRNIDIFSGVLEEALELNRNTGLFGMSLGGIESSYLKGQGVVFEIGTPLANRRNRLGLASLNSAMRSVSGTGNPFESILRQATTATTQRQPVADRGVPADGFYQDMMDRIARVDYSLVVNTAIQQVAESARSLRSIGELDEDDYEEMRAEIDGWRDEMQRNLNELSELEQQIRGADVTADAASQADRSSTLNEQLDALLAKIEPLREQALAKAAELKGQTEIAEREYKELWQRDLDEFEARLYGAMCDYGSTLRELPDSENISFILTNLGDESAEDTRRRDKIHILTKSDVLQCQGGDIDTATLRQRSAQYSY